MAIEISYLLEMAEDGVVTYESEEAVAAQILEWFDTPVGSIWGKPSWGHNLNQFKHEPMNNTTAIAVENTVLLKLPVDLPEAKIQAVTLTESDVDIWVFSISTPLVSETITKVFS